MRLLEPAIFVVNFVVLLGLAFPKFGKWKWLRWLPILAGVLIPVHLLVDGYRWQMVPVFVITGLLVLLGVLWSGPRPLIKLKWLRIVVKVLVGIIFLGALIFPLLLPIVDLPEPAGPFDVGTTSLRITDDTRPEIFTADPDDVRSVLVQVWYPADVEKGIKTAPYWDAAGITGKAYSINAGMGTFWYAHLNQVRTNSYFDAPISAAEARYPVVIYSHAFVGLPTENTLLMEELASQGYIVFSIAHSYEAIVSVFPDGEPVLTDYEYIFETYDSNYEQEEQLYKDYDQAADLVEKQEILRQILVVDDSSNVMLAARTADVILLLDELESGKGPFDNRLDLGNVGIMGWSFGGATAVNSCISDQRFKAAVNLDGWPYGEPFASDTAMTQPLMLVSNTSEWGDETDQVARQILLGRTEGDAYHLKIAGAEHENFWDFPLFFGIYKYIDFWGPISGQRMAEINGSYVTAFFDRYLKGESAPILDAPTPFDEVEYQGP